MIRVIHRTAVEQDQVLVGGAAADIEAARSLAHRFHARQGHHHLQGVGFTESYRYVLDQVDAHPFDAHLRRTVLRHAFRRDHGSLEGIDFLFHHHVEGAVVIDHQVEKHVFIGKTTETQFIGPARDRNLVESEGVGLGKGPAVLEIDRDARQGLAAGDVAHIAADRRTAALVDAVGIADLIGLVLEGHDRSLIGQIFLERRIDGRRLARVEIARGKPGGKVHAPNDEVFAVAFGHGVSVLPELGESLLQERFAGYADRIVAVVGRIAGNIDVRRNLGPDESDEFVDFDLVDAENRFGRLCGGKSAAGEQKQAKDMLFHRDSTNFRASVQNRSSGI